MRRCLRAPLLGLTVALAGCGASAGGDELAGPSSATLRAQLDRATAPREAAFPSARRRTLQEVADLAQAAGTQVGLATSNHTVGTSRLAFGLIDRDNRFVYGPSAVYVAPRPGAPAAGPFPAPADLLITDAPFRSRTAASGEDIFAAVYQAEVPLKRAGRSAVLVLTRIGGRLVGATSEIDVHAPDRDRVVAVGKAAPSVSTDTVASAAGDVESIETRVPPDDMHRTNLEDALGRKPVALLFATPGLCASRVCGPVVDIAAQLKRTYGERIEFIHQEVYVDNQPQRGLRPSLRAFGLTTEPWLFTIDREGRVAARLEGSFGFRAFERAIRAAL